MNSVVEATEEHIWDILRAIPDPEMPTINLVDLGVIRKVRVDDDKGRVLVELLPTFVGCPALDLMRLEIRQRLGAFGTIEVKIVYSEVWTTERITEAGRTMLRAAAITPPPRRSLKVLSKLEQAVSHECPLCHSMNTQLDNLFGPTPCRAIGYCNDCHQPFEQFKAV